MGNCIQTEQERINKKNFLEMAKEFETLPGIEQYGNHATGMWKRIVQMTKEASEGYDTVKGAKNNAPTVEQLKLMRRIMDREVRKLTKTRGGFAKWLYLPQEIFGDVDFVGKWYGDVQKSNEAYKGHTQYFNTQLNNMITELTTASANAGAKFSKSEKELRKHYAEYNKYRMQKKHDKANEVMTNKIDPFIKSKEGEVLSDFHKLVSGGKKNFEQNSIGKDINLKRAAEIYLNKVQPKATEIMVQGLRNYRWSLQRNNSILKNFENYSKLTNKNNTGVLDSIIERFESGNLQKDGYFPVLSFDVMPTLARASENIFAYGNGKKNQSDFNKGYDTIKNLDKIINENMYINKHLGKKTLDIEGPIDYNVIPIIDSYVRSATRFNYVSYNNGKYIDVMKNITDTYSKGKKTALDKKLSFLESYVSDHYNLITGEKVNNSPVASQIARSITAVQFASKLGLNVRGAARNATQSMFNYIWFGANGMNEHRTFKKDAQMQERLTNGLANNGILFPEIQEVYGNLALDTVYDAGTGTYKLKIDKSIGDRIGDALSKVAEKSGTLMTLVENKVNRRYTFELGYAMQWKLDNANPRLEAEFQQSLKRDLKREGKKRTVEELKRPDAERDFQIFEKNDATEYQYRMEMWRRKRAENHGNSTVNNLHYDYSITGKSKVLTTPTGSVLGQFQHYGLNFFNMQRKIVRDGKDAMLSGDWNSAAGWRMYRLGSMYAVINAIISPLTNANWGNLVQNDTYERIQNYVDAASSDPEKAKKAFFGKGPVLGTVGGPAIADLVSLGNLSGLYEMKEGTWASYLAGYQDWTDTSGTRKMQELVRILNTQLHRSIYSTLPKFRDGVNLGVITQGELGLFPTSQTRGAKERLQKIPGLGPMITPKDKDKKKSKAPRNFNEEVLKALDNF